MIFSKIEMKKFNEEQLKVAYKNIGYHADKYYKNKEVNGEYHLKDVLRCYDEALRVKNRIDELGGTSND